MSQTGIAHERCQIPFACSPLIFGSRPAGVSTDITLGFVNAVVELLVVILNLLRRLRCQLCDPVVELLHNVQAFIARVSGRSSASRASS